MGDEKYMSRCLELASIGLGAVAPNPMVGAVLVYEDSIIGEGYHQAYGGPHAEVNCIQSVKSSHESLISASTLFVSLEPCTHFGKTPPCANLIIENKIKKVVIASLDCNELIKGKGVKLLEANGVEVRLGCLDEAQQALNKRFYTYHEKKRPYVLLKWAETADGFMGEVGKKTKITDLIQDIAVHKRRFEEQAIMVGTNTALIDDPQLNNRFWPGKSPIRVLLDRSLKVGREAKVYAPSEKVIVLNEKLQEVVNNIYYVKLVDFSPQNILNQLYKLNIQSIMIEGGASLLKSFIEEGLYDEVLIFKGKNLLKSGIKSPVI